VKVTSVDHGRRRQAITVRRVGRRISPIKAVADPLIDPQRSSFSTCRTVVAKPNASALNRQVTSAPMPRRDARQHADPDDLHQPTLRGV